MNKTVALFSRGLLGVASLALQPVQAAAPAVVLQALGDTFETAGQFTLGFQFLVTEELRLVTLGVFDAGQDGLSSPAQVSLWDDWTGDLLATTEIAAGTGATLDGHFRQVAVNPVLLTPGVLYVVGAYLPAGEATSLNMGDGGSSGSFDGRLSGIMDRYWSDFSPSGNGNDFPLDSSFQGQGAWLGANFQLSAVPEPATAGLLAMGLLAAALRRRLHRALDDEPQPR